MRNISILYRFKPLLVVLGWATSLATLTLGVMFQGLLLPNASELPPESYGASSLWLWVFYLGSFGICILAAMLISDLGQSVVSVFFVYGLTGLITFAVLALPDFLGILQPPGVLQEPAVSFAFNALFPFPLFVYFIGTIAGNVLGERLL
jgi:hypothetical protein